MATRVLKTMTLSSPAFWDLHLHGAYGIDFMHATADEAVECARKLQKRGIGYFAPTLLSAEPKALFKACQTWGTLLQKRSHSSKWYPKDAACPIGLHLEGPFLNPKLSGAHPLKGLSAPDLTYAKQLIEKAQGHIAIVTLAPELAGAKALISTFLKQHIRVQAGHSTATTQEALNAAQWGISGVTHLFNAMRIHHRDPGWLAPVIRKQITAEIITDGEHIDQDFLSWAIQAAGSQLYAVSDGCSVAGCTKHQKTTLGDLKVQRAGKVAVVSKTGTIAGGATFLTDHPALLKDIPLKAERLLALFYERQCEFFPDTHHSSQAPRNVFCAKSLKFQGTV